MAAHSPPSHLTLEEFDRVYGGEKPSYEYWDGQAVQKPMPTLLHSLLQLVLANLLWEVGLTAAGEVRLKLSQTRQPLPDVIAGEYLEHPYPTEPFAVAIEILSPDDRMQLLLRRCRFLSGQGIPYVYVFDPEDRTAQRWNNETSALENTKTLEYGRGPGIPVERIWSELDSKLQKVKFPS